MKVQNISLNLFKSNVVNNSYKNNYSNKTNSIPFDSVSFGKKYATNVEVQTLVDETNQKLSEARNIVKIGNDVAKDSDEIISTAKGLFVESLAHIKAIKAAPTTGVLLAPNGNIISFYFDVKDDVYLQYSESNLKGDLLKLVTAQNFIPTRITVMNGKKGDIYQYNNSTVVATRNANVMCSPIGQTDGIYTYENGDLKRVSVNGNPVLNPTLFEYMFFYNKNKSVSVAAKDVSTNDEGYFCSKEYVFTKDGKMHIAFDNLHDKNSGEMHWDKSYHCYGPSLARIEGAHSPAGVEHVYFDKAIYPDRPGRYFTKENGIYISNEFGELNFGF